MIPSIRNKIETELADIEKKFEEDMNGFAKKAGVIAKLPEKGMEFDEIMKKVDIYMDLGTSNWQDGFCSGAVYSFNDEVINLMTAVYGKTLLTNPLHSDIFPG